MRIYNSFFIGGGQGNTITGSYSAIVGGKGNDEGGMGFTGMYGNGLIATVSPTTMGVPSAFWVDELVVPNIPVILTPGGLSSLPFGAL